jgi:hypothetical protein
VDGYFSNRWVAASYFLLLVVAIVLLLIGGAPVARAVGAGALALCPGLSVIGFFDWQRQAERDASAKAELDQTAHVKDLVGYARGMEERIGRNVTPWLTCSEMPLFQEHFAVLTQKVWGWWRTEVFQQSNPWWRPDDDERAIRAQAKMELHVVVQGLEQMPGSCQRCREIAAARSQATQQSLLRSIRSRFFRLPWQRSAHRD